MSQSNENLNITQNPHGGSIWVAAIIVVCFFIVLLDGLDSVSITFVAPTLAVIWGLPVSAMSPVFLATSLGAMIGYITAGPLALRMGERKLMLVSVALFGLGTLATTFATGIISLSVLRLFTAMGLSAVLPLAVGAASSVVSPSRRATTAILTALGLSAGGALAGFLGGPLIAHYGWTSVFLLGGVLPLLLLPAIFLFFPASSTGLVETSKKNPVLSLFESRLGLQTVLLWLVSFIIFVEAYAFLYWTPTLLINGGMAKDLAPASAGALSMGSLVGGAILIFSVSRLGVARSLMLYLAFGMACILLFGLTDMQQATLMPIVFGIGAGLLPCCVGQSALAVAIYPVHLRATGVGCAAAAGRLGSIVGPGIGGMVIALSWSSQHIVLLATIPSVAAIIVLAVTYFLAPKTEPAAHVAASS